MFLLLIGVLYFFDQNSDEIVFAGEQDNTYHMFKTDGINTPTQLTDNYSIRNPRWSPDGTMLIAKNSSGIVIVNSDGTNETLLTFEGVNEPRWNLSGDKIIFYKKQYPTFVRLGWYWEF